MDPIRVMLVDDAADARMLIGLILGEHDHLSVVGEADGADAAMALLADARPDVALLDARMPVVDGFELARMLRAAAPGLRIAILTSMVDEVTESEARAAGADACFSKGDLPDLPQLVSALRDQARP